MTTRRPKALTTAQSVDSDAVLYLRVSSEGQVNTDYNPEGISLPAQRKAANERAHEIGAPVVTEFIDPGKTAKSIEHRDAFRDMISYLRAHPNVRYVVVYALSRFARNRYDDAIMMATLEKLGVHLVSATERNLDDTPAGRAMHGMLAVFNEYQVLVSGEDIKYKMGQKARSGGTLGIAKLGYQNVRIKYDGREIRTIAVDPERAPYVTMAFELYATGQYSFPELRDALTDAGLRTKGNRRYGPRPLSIHTIGNMLRDRYYLGTVTYDGVEYPGRHEALITPDLFERVQKILYVERGAGTRERVHDHYLKGTVWCARCKRRLILRPSTSKTGNRYFYYICRGVQEHDCDLPSLPVAKVEKAVTDHYARVTIPGQHRATLETLAADACTDSQETTTKLRTNLRRQLTELDRQEDRYLDLLGDPDWPEQKLKTKMRDVRNNKQRITGNSKKPPTPSTPDAPSSPPHSTYSRGHAICTTPPPTTPANYSTRRSSPGSTSTPAPPATPPSRPTISTSPSAASSTPSGPQTAANSHKALRTPHTDVRTTLSYALAAFSHPPLRVRVRVRPPWWS
jgi:site-specific DNA recombinase